MKKIIVTTDFSPASKSAIRFAINWSTQQKLSVIFTHVHFIPDAPGLSDTSRKAYEKQQLKEVDSKLKAFIVEIYNELNIEPEKISTLVLDGVDATLSLLEYCKMHPNYDCICISTRGAGKIKKYLGTNTGNLINHSTTPVMVVPSDYKGYELTKVLYATDMTNFDEETQKVISFAKPLKATVEMVHYTWPNETLLDEDLITAPFKKHFKFGIDFHYEKNDAVHSFINRMESLIAEKKPSVVVMFTNQERTFFQKIFLSSKSEELSFKTKVPLLVYKK